MADTGDMICGALRNGDAHLRATGLAFWPESSFRKPALTDWAKSFDLSKKRFYDRLLTASQEHWRAGGDVFAGGQRPSRFPILLKAFAILPERAEQARLEGCFDPSLAKDEHAPTKKLADWAAMMWRVRCIANTGCTDV